MAKTKEVKSTVFISPNSRSDTERFVGTARGNYLVKTGTAVEVPADVKEAVELAEMQQNAMNRTIDKLRLKDD